MDAIDTNILDLLSKDSKPTLKALADRVGLSHRLCKLGLKN
jgi:DNA-binding Lrp family transcriptional regulator